MLLPLHFEQAFNEYRNVNCMPDLKDIRIFWVEDDDYGNTFSILPILNHGSIDLHGITFAYIERVDEDGLVTWRAEFVERESEDSQFTEEQRDYIRSKALRLPPHWGRPLMEALKNHYGDDTSTAALKARLEAVEENLEDLREILKISKKGNRAARSVDL